MNEIVVNKEDRKKISIYFSHEKKISMQLRDNLYEQYKNILIKDNIFQLICSQNQTNDFTFYKNCKILEIRNKSAYFTFDKIVVISKEKINSILRKSKLIQLNDKTE